MLLNVCLTHSFSSGSTSSMELDCPLKTRIDDGTQLSQEPVLAFNTDSELEENRPLTVNRTDSGEQSIEATELNYSDEETVGYGRWFLNGAKWAAVEVGQGMLRAGKDAVRVVGEIASVAQPALERGVQQVTSAVGSIGQEAVLSMIKEPDVRKVVIHASGQELVKGLHWAAGQAGSKEKQITGFIKDRIDEEAISQGIACGARRLNRQAEQSQIDSVANALLPVIKDYAAESLSKAFIDKIKQLAIWSESEEGAREIHSQLTDRLPLLEELLATPASKSSEDPKPQEESERDKYTKSIKEIVEKISNQAINQGVAQGAVWAKEHLEINPVINDAIDKALIQMTSDLAELTDENLDEVLEQIQRVITTALIKAQSDLVAEIIQWGADNPRAIEAASNNLIERITGAIVDHVDPLPGAYKNVKAESIPWQVTYQRENYFRPMIRGGLRTALIWGPDLAGRYKDQITDFVEACICQADDVAGEAINSVLREKLKEIQHTADECREEKKGFGELTRKLDDKQKAAEQRQQDLMPVKPVEMAAVGTNPEKEADFREFYEGLNKGFLAEQVVPGEIDTESQSSEVVYGVPAATNERQAPEVETQEGLWSTLQETAAPALGRAVAEALRLGNGEIEHNMEAIQSVIAPHVQAIINDVVQEIVPDIVDHLGEPSDGDLHQITAALTEHIQGVLAGVVNQGVETGFKHAVDWVDGNVETIQRMVEETLRFTLHNTLEPFAERMDRETLEVLVGKFNQASVDDMTDALRQDYVNIAKTLLAQVAMTPDALTEEDVAILLNSGLLTYEQEAILRTNQTINHEIGNYVRLVSEEVINGGTDAASAGKTLGLRDYQRNIISALNSGNPLLVTRLMQLLNSFADGKSDRIIKASVDESMLINNIRDQLAHLVSVSPIESALDGALKQGMKQVANGVDEWVTSNATTQTAPRLKRAINQVLRRVIASGAGWVGRNVDDLSEEIVPRIQQIVTEKLVAVQADIVRGVADWMSDEDNSKKLVSAFIPHLQEEVSKMVTQAVTQQVSEGTGTSVEAIAPVIGPFVEPIVNSVLNQAGVYGVKWAGGWIAENGDSVTALIKPLIENVVEERKSDILQAVKNQAVLKAAHESQDIDFNVLAAELAVEFAASFDSAELSSGYITVEPNARIPNELPKLLCLLAQTAEVYERLGGSLDEPVNIDRLSMGDLKLKDIHASLKRMPDGSIQIRKLSCSCLDFLEPDRELELTVKQVTLSYQLPKRSKLNRAALISAASVLRPECTAAALLDAFCPDSVSMRIGSIKGQFHGRWFPGETEDTVSFHLANTSLEFDVQKYYPKAYMDMRVKPGTIVCGVKTDGLVESIDADIDLDKNRNGLVKAKGTADPAKLGRVLGWFVGNVRFHAEIPVKSGLISLNDSDCLTVNTGHRIAQPICNALVKNTLKSNTPGLTLTDNGLVLKLKLKLFSEDNAYRIVRWFARAANRMFSFFVPKMIEVPITVSGYAAMPAGERGLGVFNINQFIDGIFPWPVSLGCDKHERTLNNISTAVEERRDNRLLDKALKWKSHVFEEMQLGNNASANRLLRVVPKQAISSLVEDVKQNSDDQRRRDLIRVLGLLTIVEPEKAVTVINDSGVSMSSTADSELSDLSVEQPWLAGLISERINEPYPRESGEETGLNFVNDTRQLRRLMGYWRTSLNNPNGCIYKEQALEDVNSGLVKQGGEKIAEYVKGEGEKVRMLLPPDLINVLSPEFGFTDKLLNPARNRGGADEGYSRSEDNEPRLESVNVPESRDVKRKSTIVSIETQLAYEPEDDLGFSEDLAAVPDKYTSTGFYIK